VETENHEQVVEEIGNLADNLFFVVGHRGNDDLSRFFADLLQDLLLSGGKELAGVRTFSRISLSIQVHVKDSLEDGRFAFLFGLPARPYLGKQATRQFRELLGTVMVLS